MTYEELLAQLMSANEELNKGNYQVAEQLASQVIMELRNPRDPLETGDVSKVRLQARALYFLAMTSAQGGMYDRALEQAQQLLDFSEENSLLEEISKAWNTFGCIYRDIGVYDKALEYYAKALANHQEFGEKAGIANITSNIGNVHYKLGSYDKALEYYIQALRIQEELGEKPGVANVTGNIGLVYQSLGSYDKSLEYLYKSLAIHEELGAISSVALFMSNIGNTYSLLEINDKSLEYMMKALSVYEELGKKSGISQVMGNIGSHYAIQKYEQYNPAKAEEYLLKAIVINEQIGTKQQLYFCHKCLSQLYKIEKRWEECILHFEQYHELEKEVQSEEAAKQASQMEHRRKIEESERDRQVKLARFQEQEKILHNILPSQIADRMIDGEKTIADSHENVSVFFSDIVGFTKLSQRVSAEELVGMLNGIFTQFDQLARKHGLEKIKTIGDAYMAVCGAPIQVGNHAERTALFALDVAELMNNYQTNAGDKVMIRIGLHSGGVVAGIIGENKFAYDMWGDAVNTASRMESHGEAGKIHVSEEFMQAAGESAFHFIERGKINIKGKGMMKTYFLTKDKS